LKKEKTTKKNQKLKKQKVSKSILDGRTEEFNNIKLFFDKLDDVDAKNLRQLVDECKKDIKSGIVCLIATYEGKSSIAIGVTNDLLNNYDAVNLVKTSSEILGGKGGGGRKDMALAGAKDVTKSEDVFEQLLKEIKKDS
jgi:Alanyl-tRNA synthetase